MLPLDFSLLLARRCAGYTTETEDKQRTNKMNTYIFTTDRGMEIEIDAWFREQAVKDFCFYYDPEIFVKVEKLEKTPSD